MKKILMAVLAILVLGGGAASVPSGPAYAGSAEAATHDKPKKAESHDAEGDGHGGASVSFVRMAPLVLPIIDNDGVTQTVSLVVVLEVNDEATADEVKMLSPRLKDAYIQNMYGMLNRHAILEGGVLKVADIKAKLNSITQKVMGEDKVNDVLLEVVQQRPI